jgi:hypothetical protein
MTYKKKSSTRRREASGSDKIKGDQTGSIKDWRAAIKAWEERTGNVNQTDYARRRKRILSK